MSLTTTQHDDGSVTLLDQIMEYAQKRRQEYADLALQATKRGMEAKKLALQSHELAYFDVMQEIERIRKAAPSEVEQLRKGLVPKELRELSEAAIPGEIEMHYTHDATGYPCFYVHGLSGEQKRDGPRLQATVRLFAKTVNYVRRALAAKS